MSWLGFDDPWVLWLLPLALLPLIAPAGTPLPNGWLRYAPRDRASEAIGWALRGATTLAIAALVFGFVSRLRRARRTRRADRCACVDRPRARRSSARTCASPGTRPRLPARTRAAPCTPCHASRTRRRPLCAAGVRRRTSTCRPPR